MRVVGSLLRRMRGNSLVKGAARAGLVGRGVFYLLLAVLAASLLLRPRGRGPQANANGALTQLATNPKGLLPLS